MNGLSKWVRKGVVHYNNTRDMFHSLNMFTSVNIYYFILFFMISTLIFNVCWFLSLIFRFSMIYAESNFTNILIVSTFRFSYDPCRFPGLIFK